MIDSDLILKRLDVLSLQVAKLTEVAEKTSKRKGIFSRGPDHGGVALNG